jgi:molecular chaperone IbpA
MTTIRKRRQGLSSNRKLLKRKRIFDMTRFDFTPYRRNTVGFDRLFDLLENVNRAGGATIIPLQHRTQGRGFYRITLAVAGFKPADIDITAQQNLLVIQGRKHDEHTAPQGEYLHLGIAQRGFERRFELADFVRVEAANLEDGLLVIDLLREVPEAMKPKKIAIGTAGPAALTVVEGKNAA